MLQYSAAAATAATHLPAYCWMSATFYLPLFAAADPVCTTADPTTTSMAAAPLLLLADPARCLLYHCFCECC